MMASEKVKTNPEKRKEYPQSRLKLLLHKNVLKVPAMGTAISVVTVSKDGSRNLLPLVCSNTTSKILATFDEPQVDLEVSIDNSLSPQNMNFSLEVQNILSRFEVNKHSYATLRNLRQRKLQIVPQSSKAGQASIRSFAKSEGISHETAAHVMSQMTFYVAYAKRDREINLYDIQIHDIWRGKKFLVEVVKQDTVQSLKLLIQNENRVPPSEQRLIYRGKILQDDQTLQNYEIIKSSKLSLVTGAESIRLDSGSIIAPTGDAEEASSRQLTTKLKHFKGQGTNSMEGGTERGIIVFKDSPGQPYRFRRFECDRNTRIRPFVIEFRYSKNNNS
ncbi:unnamed protein product [Allacma fusca]|uniref:Ubiquitin-like domain-containing protein n=1 Tax=Allacma fusca TaxID=39272 RepID=A0A8J2LGM9_9HEXA|nr:unnamed protein product [Allacma fusca]